MRDGWWWSTNPFTQPLAHKPQTHTPHLIRQYDYDVDEDDDPDDAPDTTTYPFPAKPPTPRGSNPSYLGRHTSDLFSLRSPAVGAGAGGGGAPPAQPSLRRLASSSKLSTGSGSHERQAPPLLGSLGTAPSFFMHGALETLGKGLWGLQQLRREAREGDDEISDRIVIQTHSTGAMEELTRGLGFHRAYCPHVLRLRLMAYGTCYPGIMSWVMTLLRGDPFWEEDTAASTPMPGWYRAFRAGAQQRIGAWGAGGGQWGCGCVVGIIMRCGLRFTESPHSLTPRIMLYHFHHRSPVPRGRRAGVAAGGAELRGDRAL